MLQEHNKFRLMDENKLNEFYAEVNWSKDPSVTECKLVKFIFPNGDEALVKREQLNEILFIIGREEDQRKMIPQTLTEQKYVKTVMGIKAHKNIRKGETINVRVDIPLPATKQEIIGVKHV